MKCEYDTETLKCRKCGHVALALPTFRNCRPPPPPPPPPGLGDYIAAATKAIGFRECGGCGRRRAWLNEAGRRFGIGVPS